MTHILPFKPMTVDDVAAVLGVSVRTVENHIADQGLPCPVKIGKVRYWHPEVFYGWLDARLRGGVECVQKETLSTLPMTRCESRCRQKQTTATNPMHSRLAGSAVERARMRDEARLRALDDA